MAEKNRNSSWYASLVALPEVLLNKFGWPGTTVIFVFWFVVKYATSEQKQEIIDAFVLGKNFPNLYVPIVIGVLSFAIITAQQFYYNRRTKEMQKEIDRLSNWKTQQQEKSIGKSLHHTEKKGD